MIEIQIDPQSKYPHIEPEEILETCGLPPIWVKQYIRGNRKGDTLKEHMEASYGFGLWESTAVIEEDLTFTYPDDPNMAPLLVMDVPDTGEKFVQYPYAMVAIKQPNGEWFVTRMD